MRIRVRLVRHEDYLQAKLSGEYPAGEFLTKLSSKMVHLLEMNSLKKILIDAREIEPPQNELDRYFVGEVIAEKTKYKYLTSIITRKGEFNNFSETVARNRGASLLITDDINTAAEWLSIDPSTILNIK